MGRQPYTVRLALGRSAFEPPDSAARAEAERAEDEDRAQRRPEDSNNVYKERRVQRYDAHGHPRNSASRAIARSLIRAQNDVLATVGVCVGVRPDGKTIEQPSTASASVNDDGELVATLREENEVGLLISACDIGLQYANHFWLRAARARVQLFRSPAEVGFLQILQERYQSAGPLAFFFTGAPALFVTMCLDVAREYSRLRIREFVSVKSLKDTSHRSRKSFARFVASTGSVCINIATSLIIEPLRVFAMLQGVGLIPAWPILPSLWSLLPFTSTSPLQLPVAAGDGSRLTVISFMRSIAASPIVLSYCSFYIRHRVEHRIYMYLRRLITKPDNPDKQSITAAVQEELDEHTIPGIGFMQDPSDRSIVKIDALPRFTDDIQIFRRWLGELFRVKALTGFAEMALLNGNKNRGERDTEPGVSHATFNHAAQANGPQGEAQITLGGSVDVAPQTNELMDLLEVDASSSGSEDTPMERASNAVRVTSHEGGVETVTVEVDITSPFPNTAEYMGDSAGGEANQGGPRQSVASSGHRAGNAPEAALPQHRLTCLSTLPADSLATMISRHIARLVVLPLESFVIRTIAFHFLAAAGTPTQRANAALVRAQLYSPTVWFGIELGTTGWRAACSSAAGYMGRLLLCVGFEAVTSFGLWEMTYMTSLWLGKKYFGWGKTRLIPFDL